MPLKKNGLLLVGFDSLSVHLINKWLPSLKTFRELINDNNSLYGTLISTMPPLSPVAWSSLVTGLHPSKTGIYDWIIFDKYKLSYRFPSSYDVMGRTFWDILSILRPNLKICLIGLPVVSYPAYKIKNGCMISGIPAKKISIDSVYPPKILDELPTRLRELSITPLINVEKRRNESFNYNTLIQHMLDWRDLALTLFDYDDWDIFLVVFIETDQMQHYFWAHMDENHPLHNSVSPGYRNAIYDVYKLSDRILGELLNRIDDDFHLIVCSDHGHGPIYSELSVNLLLNKLKFTKIKESYVNKMHTNSKLKWVLRDMALSLIQRSDFLERISQNLPGVLERKIINRFRFLWLKSSVDEVLDAIEYPASNAFAIGEAGNIYVSPSFQNDDEWLDVLYLKLTKSLNKLNHLVEKKYGWESKFYVYKTSDIYSTVKKNVSPDIILWGNYIKLTPKIKKTLLSLPKKSGDHTLDGFYLLYSSSKKLLDSNNSQGLGQRMNRHIVDIAPTILYLLNVGIPDVMDGRVIPKTKSGHTKIINWRMYERMYLLKKKMKKSPKKSSKKNE